MKKKVLLLLVLLALSLLWFAAWFQHVKAYNQMIDNYREMLGDYLVDDIMDFRPVWDWGNGPLFLTIGFSLVALWASLVLSLGCLLIRKNV